MLVHAAVLWLSACHCAALCWCTTHTPFLLLLVTTTTVQHHAHGACACMFVSVPSVQHTHDVRRKEGRGERVCGLFVLLFCVCVTGFSPSSIHPHPQESMCSVCGVCMVMQSAQQQVREERKEERGERREEEESSQSTKTKEQKREKAK